MRVLSASVVLSSIALGGWLTGAAAQSVDPSMPSAQNSAGGFAGSSENLPPGIIPQPSVDSPGVVVGVTLGELYTDNLMLAPSGRPKQTGWITEIQPFIKSAYSGLRFSGVFDYTLTGYLYEGQSRHNQLAQNLDTHGTLTLLPQHFFLDGSALYGREVVNSELPAGSGTFFLDNNRANVGRGTLSPYWIQELGNVGSAMLRYSYGRVLYNTKGIPAQSNDLLIGTSDITSNAVQFNLVSPKDQKWTWNFGYVDQRIEFDSGRSSRFSIARLGGAVQVRDDVSLLADVGRENKFLADGTVDRLGASFWDAGVEWSNTLNDFKVLVGHRFYGRSYQLSWTRTAALLTTVASYVERPTDLNQQLLGQGTDAIPSLGLPVIPSLREQRVYLMKRATASAAYEMPKGVLRVTLYDERRNYFLLNSGRERVTNADVAWLFNIGPLTTLTPTYAWQRYRYRDGQTNYSQYAQLDLVHQLDPKNFASLRLRRYSRHVHAVSSDAHGYRANVVFLQFTHLF
ncbi:TIGR03016 family PEP-CTERM system-associated outer membrane protein [Rhodanobacter thiooxydans]|nr:TIGR03016 family PEP-CTERM system-associated outer membrane protein [Rhodanobacter thiooxydans]MCW0200485.1 TIGR03016 family PEP-CTERM system-associated outer membrane protein [Rhodanobacter thiooxydans]